MILAFPSEVLPPLNAVSSILLYMRLFQYLAFQI